MSRDFACPGDPRHPSGHSKPSSPPELVGPLLVEGDQRSHCPPQALGLPRWYSRQAALNCSLLRALQALTLSCQSSSRSSGSTSPFRAPRSIKARAPSRPSRRARRLPPPSPRWHFPRWSIQPGTPVTRSFCSPRACNAGLPAYPRLPLDRAAWCLPNPCHSPWPYPPRFPSSKSIYFMGVPIRGAAYLRLSVYKC